MKRNKQEQHKKTIGKVILTPSILILLIFPLLACGIFYTTAHQYATREAKDRLMELREAVLPEMENVFQADSTEEPRVLVGRFVRQVAPITRRMEGDTRLMIFAAENRVVYPRDEEERAYVKPVSDAFSAYIAAYENEAALSDNAYDQTSSETIRIKAENNEEFLASIYPSPITSLQIRYIITYCPVAEMDAWIRTASLLVLFISLVSAIVLIGLLRSTARTMTGQFEALAMEAERIGNGDFSPIEKTFDIEEASTVEKAMNCMAEALRVTRESEQKFYQNVSHDLRTPLMSIGGYAQGIETGVMKDPVQAAHIISEESARLTRYVSDLLTLSRLESGEKFHLEKVDLADVIEESFEHMNGLALHHGVELKIDMPSHEWIVEADPQQLVRILDNLLSNAVRYAHSRVLLQVEERRRESTETVEAHGSWMEERLRSENRGIDLRVLDDGDGISEHDLPHIFERSYKGAKGGFGFGLAIASHAARSMNATLRAENRAEGGACFTLSF